MFLKSIELFGFKSFADRTYIEFTDGISALLGPNGCGKSNVVDAVKWVLGEQAIKSLRAERMEDVIFNGTEDRKSLSMAEVSLTLENDSGILPIELSEISIKRRLYRSGESEYYINGKSVKLKQLRELFFDTGIGKTAYSIMEQGKIDQVLSNKPEERRNIFEEAAAITKYKIKGQEAERKLQRTEENMRQAESILAEVKRNHDSLKKQSEKTLKYRELREKSFKLEIDIQLLRLRNFLEEQNKKETELEAKRKDRDAINQEIETINQSMELNLDKVNNMENLLVENQKKIYGLELEVGAKENQIKMLTERLSETEEKINSARSREKGIQEKVKSLSEDIAAQEKTMEETAASVKKVDKNIEQFEGHIKTAAERMSNNNKDIETKQKAIFRLDQRQEQLETEIRSLTDDIVRQLDQGLKESGYSQNERKRLEEQIGEILESIRISIKGKRDLIGDIKSTESISAKEAKRIIVLSDSLFDELEKEHGELERLFEHYRQMNPHFLDDFLAPEGIITQKRGLDEEVFSVRLEMRKSRSQIQELTDENNQLSEKIDTYRKTLEELRMNKVQRETQYRAIKDSIERSYTQKSEQENLLEQISEEVELEKNRLSKIKSQIEERKEEKQALIGDEKKLKSDLDSLQNTISSSNKDLIEKEKQVKEKMAALTKVQKIVEDLQMKQAEISTEIRNIYENFQDRHSRDLKEFESRLYEINENGKVLRERLSSIRNEQKALGQVNLMAPEEYAEVKERFDFLTKQLDDLRKAREDLNRVTEEIRKESSNLFIQTYEKIKKNFHLMFRRLFGGGRGELKLTEPDNILESGIEIYAQPPGKKLESINLLSGGEKSLTAVALLFATYMVKPSPFCLLDEIDAALDEHNVGRFLSMLREFAESSQFIIITHNKKTVAGSRSLLGITMEESGVSRVISLRLDKMEAAHA